MATIIKREKADKRPSYFVVWWWEGKPRWKKAGERRIDAERLKSKLENDLHQGVYQEMPDIAFEEFSKKFLEAHAHRVRLGTLTNYESHLRKRLVPYFKGRKLKSIRAVDIEAFLSELKKEGMSPATAKKHLTTLKTILRRACEWGFLARNPARFIKPPRVERKEFDCLSPGEMEKLIKATDEKHKALVVLSCHTGLRQSEALGLSWDDVDFESNRLFIRRTWQRGKFYEPKTRASRRAVPLSPVLVKTLKEHQLKQMVELDKNPHNLVFVNEEGNPLDKSNLHRRVLRPALVRAGLRQVRWHDLRHSFATALLSKGENLKFVQVLLGHSSPSITLDVYSHVLPETEKDAGQRIEAILNGV